MMQSLTDLIKLDINAMAGHLPFEIITYASIVLLIVVFAYLIRSYRKTKAKIVLVLLLWSVLFIVHEVLEIMNMFVGLQTMVGKLRIFNNAVELFTVALIFYLISR
jgi:hypothetical protein